MINSYILTKEVHRIDQFTNGAGPNELSESVY